MYCSVYFLLFFFPVLGNLVTKTVCCGFDCFVHIFGSNTRYQAKEGHLAEVI